MSMQEQKNRDILIDDISAAIIRLLSQGLPEQATSLLEYDLTIQQGRVFTYVLGQGKTTASKISSSLSIKPNVTTGIIQRLVDKGLIERQDDQDDRRMRALVVTPRGQALVDEMVGFLSARQRIALSRLNTEQLRQLRDIFTVLEP